MLEGKPRRDVQMRIAHTWGYCFSEKCVFGYPRPQTDTNPKNYTCEAKKDV